LNSRNGGSGENGGNDGDVILLYKFLRSSIEHIIPKFLMVFDDQYVLLLQQQLLLIQVSGGRDGCRTEGAAGIRILEWV
jgi:hypothetical protein